MFKGGKVQPFFYNHINFYFTFKSLFDLNAHLFFSSMHDLSLMLGLTDVYTELARNFTPIFPFSHSLLRRGGENDSLLLWPKFLNSRTRPSKNRDGDVQCGMEADKTFVVCSINGFYMYSCQLH